MQYMNMSPRRKNDTDRPLIERALAGDQSAYTELYHAHKTKIMSLLMRCTCHKQDAEDLMQETFQVAFRSLPKFRQDSSFSTWIYRVAFTHFLMSYRKRNQISRIDRYIDYDEMPSEIYDGDLGDARFTCHDSALESTPDRIDVERFLPQLPAGYREMTALRLLGYSHLEIAEILGCSVGNCKSQMNKARKSLRDMMKPPNPLIRQFQPYPVAAQNCT